LKFVLSNLQKHYINQCKTTDNLIPIVDLVVVAVIADVAAIVDVVLVEAVTVLNNTAQM